VKDESWFAALRDPDFRLYFVGRLTSFIGTGMVPVALSFAVLGEGRSTSDVGFVLGAETVPMVIFLLVGGVVADRMGRRRVMIASDLIRAAAQGGLAGWLLLGRPPLWGFLAIEAIVGAATAFFTPAMTGLVPEVAVPEHLQQANSFNAMAMWSGNLLGPAMAGVIVAGAGAGWAIGADALTYLVSALCLAMLRSRQHESRQRQSTLTDLRAGWRDFWSRTWLWTIVIQFAFFHLLVYSPFLVLGAARAKSSLGGAGAWGAVLAANGVGGVVTGIVMLRVRPRHPLVVAELAMIGWVLPLVALAARAPVVVVAGAALIAGAGAGVFGPLWDTTMQRQVPSDLLSRVSAYDYFGSILFLPLGYAIAGPIAGQLGTTTTLCFGAAVFSSSILALVLVPGVRTLPAPWTP